MQDSYPRYRRWLFGLTIVMFAAALTAPNHVQAETHTYTTKAHITDKNVEPHQEYWIVTNEIKSPAKDNVQELEVYRWDPGFLVVQKGKPVTLHFYGVKGKAHPFEIRGLGVKGNVEKGKVTSVTFTPKEVGTFPIICLTHATIEQNGPMVGYLKVQE
ncbi:cupredoxin domain-containing protein [Tumebacillus permanentifrigoris]|uniref:EfeO-type cupredoxin-like domain-containing protein n=1 Tax=Tumebacillus permanentifrigoris TaxID=378543 RepID=A0A316D8N1_9BACL|nr:cupredoxin domain-containing protein [Tumebacillus permanentifrigoris]PWK13166.1 hypothetical protein C7459_108187 [Tumebacillus permanentifrigoris]